MPTILTHPAVPLTLAAVASSRHVSPRLLMAGIIAAVLPDADVLAFKLGIAYEHAFGHRGFSHSLAFALCLGGLAAAIAPALGARRGVAFLFVFAACASHGLLDMLTNGGLGIALFWPVSAERLFFPAQVIQVSTLSLERFFGPSGLRTLVSELYWVWLPAISVSAVAVWLRRWTAMTSRQRLP